MKSLTLSIILCGVAFFASAQTKPVDSSATANPTVIDISAKLKVYPNPSSNWLFVTHPVISKKGVQLFVADLNGKTVLKVDVKTETMQSIINISSLMAGTYVVIWSNGNERGKALIRKN